MFFAGRPFLFVFVLLLLLFSLVGHGGGESARGSKILRFVHIFGPVLFFAAMEKEMWRPMPNLSWE